jgi:hypothetical protein
MNYGMCMAGIQKIGPLVRIYNIRLRRRMENEEGAYLKAH